MTMTMIPVKLVSPLRELRTLTGWTQRELAARMGLHPNTVARLERGELPLSPRIAQHCATLRFALALDSKKPRR